MGHQSSGDDRFLDSVELGAGTWQWGDLRLWGYGGDYGEAEARSAFEASLGSGVQLFDTAEIYGHGRSERLLGGFVRRLQRPVLISTKFMPRPWRLLRVNLALALRQSLWRLGLKRVDLYQVHFPDPPVAIETWMEGLADAVAGGLARAVGVSNYDLEQTRRAHAALARRGVRLAALQRHYSLLERGPETTGLLRFCHDHGIRFIAWSPLEKGLLSGKYTPERPPPGQRHRDYYPRAYLARIQPLVALLGTIGERRGKTRAQVALNWTIAKGALPIPGAKTAAQVRENAGALGWRLTDDEVAALDEMSARTFQK
jgi:aryl-alcohol dehydrogenase-like predicted oxidoreductase